MVRVHSEDLGVDGTVKLQLILGKQGGKVRNGFVCLSTGTNGVLL
jgi:hypothetical protein